MASTGGVQGMKRIRLIEIWAEISANFVAFYSIVMFVCLGVGIFLGIQWGGTAIRSATEAAFERGQMHDIEVQFPYGLTDEHLQQLQVVEGVTAVEPAYVAPARMSLDDDSYILKIQNLTSDVDRVTVVEGTLPQAQNEIAILSFWAKRHELGVGDTIQLEHDVEAETDVLGQETDEKNSDQNTGGDGMEYLNADRFKITALVDCPTCLCTVAGSQGVVNIGQVDCCAYAPTSAFDIEQYHGGYSSVSLRCDGLRGKDSFSQAYKEGLRPIAAAVEELGSRLGSERYDQVHREAETKLSEGEKQVVEGERKLTEYEAQVADADKKLAEARKELEHATDDGTVAEKQAEIDILKEVLAQKRSELEDGKKKLDEAREKVKQMKRYEWAVASRLENGGVQYVETVSGMMNQLRWAMASLFVLVGLFVCYSAVSRLVNDEIEQIGTKKAMGFREREIAAGYLSFSGLAVLVGTVAAVFVAVVVVQGIVNPKVGRQFVMSGYPPYFRLAELLLMGALELVLISLATWLAIHRLLKCNAIDLLNGGGTVEAKTRFYERWGIWRHMSLYSQTIVNNCVNDPRRVVGTLVGVIGCTTLIVTAVTLASNVSRSLERHYERVYDFDAITTLSDGGDKAAASARQALDKQGIDAAPVRRHRMLVRRQDGVRSLVSIIIPTDQEAFDQLYHVYTLSGEQVQLGDEGIWISAAFADHMGVRAGDTVALSETTGKTREFKVAGVFEYYLLRHEFLMSEAAYRAAFGSKPEANALLTDLGEADIDEVGESLSSVDGFGSIVDDSGYARRVFGEMSSLLRTVVMVYLGLSALMALVVLLNLNVMFVEEKKRELLVLRINGFSVREAQAYIYRDSIVLTLIGIALGVALGAAMGSLTVGALEPDYGHFLKGFNSKAALIGVAGAGGFATIVLFWALRRIKKFNLTDINRY